MHRFNRRATLDATADIGLVCNNDQGEARSLKSRAPLSDIIVQFEILRVRRRMRLSIADDRPVDYSVAVQKYCASHYLMRSHFVSVRLRVGCEIHKCHTTAWKASVCGVTFAVLTTGITTATSATCAV